MVALLYLDLDRFKEVNDTFGHGCGDRLLEVLAERMPRVLPKDTTLGRLAGDEFALFVDGLPADVDNRGPIAHLARSILTEVGRAVQLNEHEVFLTASIGIAFCPRDAENVIDLIRNADAAMYYSKQNGGNTFAFYSPEMNAAAVERLMLKSKLRRALERDELVIRYQPKVDLRNGRIIGAEALLRWRLPGHGDIPPSQFIPLAEETSLILDVGEWVLNRVCQDYRHMQNEVADPGRMSLNLSLKQLRQASFILRCRSVFRRHGVSPTSFELEITETTLMADAARTVRLLDELYAMGLHLSIDDFGTGYSSLSALQQFPIGTLKIDQSFVRDVSDDAGDATIVRTIIDMGRSLGMEVVAEGVESRAPSGLPAQAQLPLRPGQALRRAVHGRGSARAPEAAGCRHAALRPSAAAGGRALEPQRLRPQPGGEPSPSQRAPAAWLWRLSLVAIAAAWAITAFWQAHEADAARHAPRERLRIRCPPAASASCRHHRGGRLRTAGRVAGDLRSDARHRARRARLHRARLLPVQWRARGAGRPAAPLRALSRELRDALHRAAPRLS